MLTTHGMARWFAGIADASGPAAEFAREEILADIAKGTAYSVMGDEVAVRTANGAAILTRVEDLVVIEYVRDNRYGITKFWMNASSMASFSRLIHGMARKNGEDGFASIIYGS